MVETQTQSETKIPSLQDVKAASARVEQKAREVYDVLVDASVKWAGFSLGYGRTALTTSARALERAAERLATLEEKLPKKAPEAAAEEKAAASDATNAAPDPNVN
ncbi:hypothetical protein [Polyangium mundeleinium]|uniref:Uncharacterized protein n=1 Tax=Polyangium mundeleinium TaxID=2995306 RepID=A0ABT5F1M0_9BACT|nr:hypothetical protein [Polyangium mundeleinium]MDC0747981.1 hypothetical protein [Polyangium mundeleinium]